MEMRETIQKLLDLAGGTHSQEEAESAMLKAQELMLKHGLTEDDLRRAGKEPKVVERTMWFGYTRIPYWVIEIAGVVAENFRCYMWGSAHGYSQKIRSITIMGLEGDVAIAGDTIEFAVKAAKRSWTEHRAKVLQWHKVMDGDAGVRNGFMRGFALGLQDKFSEQVQTMALVVTKSKSVDEKMDDMVFVGNLESERQMSAIAELAGHAAGRRFATPDLIE